MQMYHRFQAHLQTSPPEAKFADVYLDSADPQLTTNNGAKHPQDDPMSVLLFSGEGRNLERAHKFFKNKMKLAHCYVTEDPIGQSLVKFFQTSSGARVHFLVHPTQKMPLVELDSIATCQMTQGRQWQPCAITASAEDEDEDIEFFDQHIGQPLLATAVHLLRMVVDAPEDAGVGINDKFLAVLLMDEIISKWLEERMNRTFDYDDFLCQLVANGMGVYERLLLIGQKFHKLEGQLWGAMLLRIMEIIGCGLVLFSADEIPQTEIPSAETPETDLRLTRLADSDPQRSDEQSVLVDWSQLDVVLRLPQEQQQVYIAATAAGDVTRVKVLESESCEGRRIDSSFPYLRASLEAGVEVEAVPGSLSLKFFNVPRALVKGLTSELVESESNHMHRLLLAYVCNHCDTLQAHPEHRSVLHAVVIDVSESDNESLLAKKYPVILPSLAMPSFITFWQAPSGISDATGIRGIQST